MPATRREAMIATMSNRKENLIRALAVVLMLGGAAMPFAGMSGGIGFPLIAIGISLIVVLRRNDDHRNSAVR